MIPQAIGNKRDAVVADESQRQHLTHLESLGGSMQGKLTEAITLRATIEGRWIDDLRQYHGRYDSQTEAELSSVNEQGEVRSKAFINLTRKYTNGAAARLGDLLFPADDKNWGIEPTPDPELSDTARQEVDLEAADAARAEMEVAENASNSMETVIDDQLTEADYPAQARDVILDAAKLGAGVIKGPFTAAKQQRNWNKTEEGDYVLNFAPALTPGTRRVDPWDFYPDLSTNDPEAWGYTFERKRSSKQQLVRLAEQQKFHPVALYNVLLEEPGAFASKDTYMQQLREISGVTGVTHHNQYELWEYTGPIEREDLEVMMDGEATEEFDELEAVRIIGKIFFIGPHVLKVQLYHLDSMDMEYSVFPWEKDEATVFGFGIPYLMRTPQRIMNSSWRMLLDNSGLSVGPQVVVDEDLITPMDGKRAISPLKLWSFKGSRFQNKSIRDAFATFEINGHQEQLAAIYQLAKELAEEETSMPQITQGEGDRAPAQVATTAMLMNAANVIIRRLVRNWDDLVTEPLITRYYDWNMQNHPDPKIKGDYAVDARGTSALLVKEMQAQSLLMLMQFVDHPVVGQYLEPKILDLLRKIVEAHHISPDSVLPTEDEAKQLRKDKENAGNEIPPEIQLEQMKLEQQAQLHEMDLRDKAQERELRMISQASTLKIEMMKMAQAQNMSIEKLAAELRKATMDNQVKLEKERIAALARQEERDFARQQNVTGIHNTV